MDFATLLQNALAQEQQIAQEIERLLRMKWTLQGQIDLLQRLIAEHPQEDSHGMDHHNLA